MCRLSPVLHYIAIAEELVEFVEITLAPRSWRRCVLMISCLMAWLEQRILVNSNPNVGSLTDTVIRKKVRGSMHVDGSSKKLDGYPSLRLLEDVA